MDYKQKYKEIFDRAKSLHRQYKGRVRAVDVVMEEIFPELKESEDERIRKWIISDLKDSIDSCAYCERTKPQALEAIAWLEKQKTSEEALEYLKENHSVDEVNDFQAAMNIAVAKAFDVGRNSKPLINKEDEEMINLLIAIFEINYPNDVYKANPIGTTNMKGVCSSEIIDWLKSLKDKVQPM